VLHVGLQKTGTTFLQKTIFPRHPTYVGLHSGHPLSTRKNLADLEHFFLDESPCSWGRDDPVPRWAQDLARQLRGERTVLFSYENLLRQPNLIEDYSCGLPAGSLWEPAKHLAKFRETLAPNASEVTVLITIRRQPEFLASLYAQYSKRFQKACQKDFEAKVKRLLRRVDSGETTLLDFSHQIKSVEREVPGARVILYPLEKIRTEEYLRAMSDELGLAIPYPVDLLRVNRPMNRRSLGRNVWELRPRKSKTPLFIRGRLSRKKTITLTETVIDEIMMRFQGGNDSIPARNLPIGLPTSYT